MPDRNITFEIREHLGTIAKYGTGWNKELNLISWNGGTPKFDIRDWDDHHEKPSRGVTLSQWEMRKMVDLYIARNNRQAVERGRAIEDERNARRAASYRQYEESLNRDDAALEAATEPVETVQAAPAEPPAPVETEEQVALPEQPATELTESAQSRPSAPTETESPLIEVPAEETKEIEEVPADEEPF